MPYWNKNESRVDVRGVEIRPGDILEACGVESTRPDNPWQYFYCEADLLCNQIEVRDCNAHNVCICEVGLEGNVVNLGHYSHHPDIIASQGQLQHPDEVPYPVVTPKYTMTKEDQEKTVAREEKRNKEFIIKRDTELSTSLIKLAITEAKEVGLQPKIFFLVMRYYADTGLELLREEQDGKS